MAGLRSPRGFSLLELMLVVAIIGIAAALSVPQMSEVVRRERSRGELTKIAGAVAAARHRARMQVCSVHLTVDVANARLTTAPDAADPDVACRALPTEVVRFDGGVVTLSPFAVAGVPTNPLVFNAEGGLEAPARALMSVQLAGASPRVIEVWPAAGTVRVK